MTILCTGSIAFDTLMTFPGYFRDHIIPEHLDKISLSFLVDTMVKQRGGNAPNIAYTLALLGSRPQVMGTVGEDFEEYRRWLEDHHIDTTYIRVIPGEATASFYANTDLNNAQIASFYTGAMRYATQISLYELAGNLPELVVISPNDPKAMDQYVAESIELEVPYLYDPGQQVVRSGPDELRRGVEGASCLFLNDYEYQLIQKHTGFTEQKLLDTLDFMVVTMGKDGACVYVKDKKYQIPVVPPQKIVDPTGVGDAFRGGFLRGFQLNFDWQVCGQMGALAATYCLENKGTQNHVFTIEEFIARYRLHFDDQGMLDILLAQIS